MPVAGVTAAAVCSVTRVATGSSGRRMPFGIGSFIERIQPRTDLVP
jgi:hypothetical protein